MKRHEVVVGYDGSKNSEVALDWAIRYAQERDLQVAVHSAMTSVPGGDLLGTPFEERLRRTEHLMHRGREKARTAGVSVRGEVSQHAAGHWLVESSRDAQVLVVGTTGSTGLAGVLWGSVSSYVAHHAHIPVVIAREPVAADLGTVVAGIDGSPLSEAVLDFAFDAASFGRGDVEVLHSGHAPGSWKSYRDTVTRADAAEDQQEQVLVGELVAGWREKYPDVPVDAEIVRSAPRDALVGASGHARLVVVGAHGGAAGWGMLGSVSQHVAQHAKCPVAVVR